jgi:hypothetical protein
MLDAGLDMRAASGTFHIIVTTFIDRYPAMRFASIFLGALGAWSIIAAAALAVVLIVQNERRPLPAAAVPSNASIHATGMIVLSPLNDAKAFKDTVGFAPVVPDDLPDLTVAAPRFFATPADDGSISAGQVRFATRADVSHDGLRGPAIALIERPRGASEVANSTVATAIASTSRIFTSDVICGSVTITAQLYFYSSGTEGPPAEAAASPVAEAFLSALRDQCAR